MTARKDGAATRQRILEAAYEVFGERGYRSATHAEICRRAGVNTAAINYHFGSKAELYRASWEHATELAERLHPLKGGVAPEAPAEERLRGLIRCMTGRLTDEALGQYHRIRMMEFSDPSGVLEDALGEQRRMHRRYTQQIMRDLLGPGATDDDVERCEMSVVAQWRMLHPRDHRRACHPFTPEAAAHLVEHITQFSLGGIERVRRQLVESKRAD